MGGSRPVYDQNCAVVKGWNHPTGLGVWQDERVFAVHLTRLKNLHAIVHICVD